MGPPPIARSSAAPSTGLCHSLPPNDLSVPYPQQRTHLLNSATPGMCGVCGSPVVEKVPAPQKTGVEVPSILPLP